MPTRSVPKAFESKIIARPTPDFRPTFTATRPDFGAAQAKPGPVQARAFDAAQVRAVHAAQARGRAMRSYSREPTISTSAKSPARKADGSHSVRNTDASISGACVARRALTTRSWSGDGPSMIT